MKLYTTWIYNGYKLILSDPFTPEEEAMMKKALDKKREEEKKKAN